MDTGLVYQALKDRQVDTGVVFATDGRIPAFKFVVLKDDKHYAPAYNMTPVVRKEILDKNPKIADALNALSAKLNDDNMAKLNASVDVDKKTVEDAAHDFLKANGCLVVAALACADVRPRALRVAGAAACVHARALRALPATSSSQARALPARPRSASRAGGAPHAGGARSAAAYAFDQLGRTRRAARASCSTAGAPASPGAAFAGATTIDASTRTTAIR